MTSAQTMQSEVKDCIVQRHEPLSHVIRVIEENRHKIVIVVDDDDRVCGAITDGDIRRALLAGHGLELPAERAMNTAPRLFSEDATVELMNAEAMRLGVRHFPIVDGQGRLLRIETLRSLAENAPGNLRDEPVLILAGGRGTRLMPLTENCPKPMLWIGDKPILQHIIERLKASGFSKFFVSVNYLAHQIESYFGDGSSWDVSIEYLREDRPLGTGGPISLLPKKVGDGPILVINGDIFSQVDFVGLMEFHVESEAVATMCIRPHVVEVPFGVVEFDNGVVRSLVEKPSHLIHVNAGIYVVGPRLRARLGSAEPIDMPDLITRGIMAGDQIMVFPIHEEWTDIGRRKDLDTVRERHEQ